MNQAILSGNLVADMEVRDLGEQHLGTFRFACDDGGERPVFMPVECWNMPHLPDYLSKGSKVLVSGRLKLNEWETDAGEKRSRVVISAYKIEFIDTGRRSKSDESGSPGLSSPSSVAPQGRGRWLAV